MQEAGLGAGFSKVRDDVALADSNTAQPAGNFLNRGLVLYPTVSLIFALAKRLVQGRRGSVFLSGRFQDRIYGATTHFDITNMNHEPLVKRVGGGGPGLKSGGGTRAAVSGRHRFRNPVRH